jgi:hypothetical protein
MKKLITTFCLVALTSVVAQAQSRGADADAAVKKEVKKEAPAKLINNVNSDAATFTKADVEAEKAKKAELKKSNQSETATQKSAAKKALISNEANRKLEVDKKKKDN